MPELDSVAFVTTLGSDAASYDDDVPWLERELEVLARAHASDVPVFGICFGSQALARSLGARTRLADAPEIGWYEVESRSAELVAPGPWLFWHRDRFDVPPGAQLLATTDAGPAAFWLRRCFGVQFHPEVTPDAVDQWIEAVGDKLAPAIRDDLRRGFADGQADVRDRAWRLYDAFLAGISRMKRGGATQIGPMV